MSDRNDDTLPRLQSSLNVIEALNISHNLFEWTIRLHILRKRPHGVTTDNSLRDRRAFVGSGLDGQTEGAGTHGEHECRKRARNNTAARGAGASTRRSRSTQE